MNAPANTNKLPRAIVANSITFLLGFASGQAVSAMRSEDPSVADDEVGSDDSSLPTGTGTGTDDSSIFDTTETGAPGGVMDYCETFPEMCNDPTPCAETIDATGKKVSACFPAEWACCAAGLGCWAVNFPSECGSAGLYWFDCQAGEQTVDPNTGEGVLVCHD